MKKFLTVILIVGATPMSVSTQDTHLVLSSSDAAETTQDEYSLDLGDNQELDGIADEPFDIVIPPTKSSISWKDIPFYAKLFFSHLYQDRIKPFYYAVVGYFTSRKAA